ncbi:MAG: ABC transporter permease [bacterium]
MGTYILRRLLYLIPILIIISIVIFVIIQLPPGDYLSSYVAGLSQTGDEVDVEHVEALRERYGLDKPVYFQYWAWISGFTRGDFGFSFEWQRPVSSLIWGRLGMTLIVVGGSTLFVWIVGFAIGFYSAVRQYSIGDYIATVIGFLGLSIPNFMLALILMWISFSFFGHNVGGLFSVEYVDAPWTLDKIIDLLKHLWIPIVVIGTAGTAGLIRIVRANLLDELSKPYMETARAKGLSERRLLLKYPVRVALIPFVATAGWTLPKLFSGAIITSVVLGLPTTGPMLLRALQSQDMYLAGSFLLLLSILTVIGTLISDILLAWIDPRIQY